MQKNVTNDPMFSLLVALAMYVTFAPAKPALSVNALRPFLLRTRSLPLAAAMPRPEIVRAPTKKDDTRLGIETTAKAAVVLDWKTGAPLFEKNDDEPMAIASITKLMSAIVVLSQKPDWKKEVEFFSTDEPSGGVQYLLPGEKVTVQDLFNMSLVASSNGATVALARSTGLTSAEFVSKMNEMAAKLGMTKSHFTDPTGLASTDEASARDVALLIRTALTYPEIQAAVQQKKYSFRAITGLDHAVRSTDELLGSFLDVAPNKFLGGKTGFIEEAGYCFGSAAENADGNRVIAVVLGAESKELRFKEVKSLIFWAFDAYEWP